MDNPWRDKRVFITGVCGTVGQELLRQVLKFDPIEVVGIDNNESELFFLNEQYRENPNVNLYLCDLRDKDRLKDRTRGVQIILHAAALKHVILCEHSPWEPIQTNILGTQNVIDVAIENQIERVIFTSSDKAVNPTNVMGTSKLMGERLMTAANAHRRGSGPIFASTRFGNVLGSRGSVIPLFTKQISNGGPVTLTHVEMTRFIMTLEEAVRLVMDSVFLAQGGEVFVTKMPIVNISDLAKVMVEVLAPKFGYNWDEIDINIIGCKPGEKLYEELLNDEETRRTIELPNYFVVLPAFKAVYNNVEYSYDGLDGKSVYETYGSNTGNALNRSELKHYLLKHKLISETIIETDKVKVEE